MIKFLPNPNLLKTKLRKSKPFSIFIVTRNPSILTNRYFQFCQKLIYQFFQQICFLYKQCVVRKLTLIKQLLVCLKELYKKFLCQHLSMKLLSSFLCIVYHDLSSQWTWQFTVSHTNTTVFKTLFTSVGIVSYNRLCFL